MTIVIDDCNKQLNRKNEATVDRNANSNQTLSSVSVFTLRDFQSFQRECAIMNERND